MTSPFAICSNDRVSDQAKTGEALATAEIVSHDENEEV